MSAYYRDERREQEDRWLAFAKILREIADALSTAATMKDAGQGRELADRAMNDLFSVMSHSNPLAFRREAHGRIAFLWSDIRKNGPPSFHWVVCHPNGSCRSGEESSERDCEETVERLLQNPG